ncbi:MAG: hypothetical protein ACPG8W_11065 [Candidatus Promineifilaceae bacterium]
MSHSTAEIPQIVFAKGGKTAIPVFAPLLVVDGVSAELIAIRMVGPAEAVKTNWAMLVSGYSKQQVTLNGTFITTRGAKHFHTLKTILPSGLVDWCLIHHQAAAQTVKPDRPFYVFTKSTSQRPEQFFAILDAGLDVPLLSVWQDFLWHTGRHCKLIESADPNPYGMAAWRINPDQAQWATLISQGLQDQFISFDGDHIVSYYTVDDALDDGTLHTVPVTNSQLTEPYSMTIKPNSVHSPHFSLGQLVMTSGAQALFAKGVDPTPILQRHCLLDADLNTGDLRANQEAAKSGLRIFSSYNTTQGKLWLITEADRSTTTYLLPSEY